MKNILLLWIVSIILSGCAINHTDTTSKLEEWKRQIDVSIPVGTDIQTVKAWFEQKGITVKPVISNNTTDMEARLGMLPAKELYCSEWILQVLIKTTFYYTVDSYKYEALGVCL